MEVKDNRPSLLNRIIEDPKLALLSLAALTLMIAGLVWVSFSGASRLASPKDNPYAAARKTQSNKLSLFAWNLMPGWGKDLARRFFSWGGSNAWADNLDAQSLARKNGFGLKGGKESRGGEREYLEGGLAGEDGENGEGGEWEIGPDGQKRWRRKSRGEGQAGGDYSASATGSGSLSARGGRGVGGASAESSRFDGIAMAGGSRAGGSGGADRAGGSGRSLARRGAAYRTGLGSYKGLKDGEGVKKIGVEAVNPLEKPAEFKPSAPPTKLIRASPQDIRGVIGKVEGTAGVLSGNLINQNYSTLRSHFHQIANLVPKVQQRADRTANGIMGDMSALRQADALLNSYPKLYWKYGVKKQKGLENIEKLPQFASQLKSSARDLNGLRTEAQDARRAADKVMGGLASANGQKEIQKFQAESLLHHMKMEQAISGHEAADYSFGTARITHLENIKTPHNNTVFAESDVRPVLEQLKRDVPVLTARRDDLQAKLSACKKNCGPIRVELEKTQRDLADATRAREQAQADLNRITDAGSRLLRQSQDMSNASGGVYPAFLDVQKSLGPSGSGRTFSGLSDKADTLQADAKAIRSEIQNLEMNEGEKLDMDGIANSARKGLKDAEINFDRVDEKGKELPRINHPDFPNGKASYGDRLWAPENAVYAVRAGQNLVEAELALKQERELLKIHEQRAVEQVKADELFKQQEAERKRKSDEEWAAYQAAEHAACIANSVSGAACP